MRRRGTLAHPVHQAIFFSIFHGRHFFPWLTIAVINHKYVDTRIVDMCAYVSNLANDIRICVCISDWRNRLRSNLVGPISQLPMNWSAAFFGPTSCSPERDYEGL